MKKILDSVHGYVEIPDKIVANIVDTVFFQRLRRIEQTSGRSIFPSARHDRFIHSIGVYNLGVRIVDSIYKHYLQIFPDYKIYNSVIFSYTIACLLHDVGHTPFSHTFESYYDVPENGIKNTLIKLVREYDSDFEDDFSKSFQDAAPHEIISAIISVKIFGNFIKSYHEYFYNGAYGDCALVARMIVGCKYIDKSKSFHNVFIELLHSKILDADSLDYVSRDAWASGYLSSKVDTVRLLNSITLHVDSYGKYSLCYDIKAINEIRAALHVKNFQQENVINHHTVVYEQALLKRAMESVATLSETERETGNATERKKHLGKICNLKGFLGELEEGDLMNFPTDDFFICRMRAYPKNRYVQEWFSRQYYLKPLWKSRERFWLYFRKFNFKELTPECWLYSNDCKKYLSEKFNIDIDDIWIENGTPKNKMATLSDLKILIDDQLINYTHLFSLDALSQQELLTCFKFIFIPPIDKNGNKLDFEVIRKDLVKEFFTNIH